ncbi:hypothetical protein A2U01_0015118 [Trifolium medium]|uniref:Increased DNA methylation 1 C-terminal domain-containing protein n=1 Tax=Trifolium medium TaxID=97028 RepID=A0A392N3L3_9FABA|nr:hypothetical protein [Trifolium medium]
MQHIPNLRDERLSKLNQACEVLKDAFPFMADVTRRVVFGESNLGGFFTMIVQKNGEVASCVSFRLHSRGNQMLAEIPFIGTHTRFRCEGLCRKLMTDLERKPNCAWRGGCIVAFASSVGA